MEAFATFFDLGLRLQRTFTTAEQGWVTALLQDAAAFMRGVMRNQVYPSQQSTYIAYPAAGWVALPQSYVQSVDSVARLGSNVQWEQHADSIRVSCSGPLTVTFTHGLTTPPNDLVGINCALAAQMMLTVESQIGLTAGGLSSIAIDDYKASFADGGIGTGLSLTEATRTYLEDHYGTTTWVVGNRR